MFEWCLEMKPSTGPPVKQDTEPKPSPPAKKEKGMTYEDLVEGDCRLIDADTTLAEAAAVLAETEEGCVVVPIRPDVVAGVLTSWEISVALGAGARPEDGAAGYASTDFEMVNALEGVEFGADRARFRVVTKDGKFFGVLDTRRHSAGLRAEHIPMLRRLSIFLDAIYNPIIAIDSSGKVMFCNKAMADIADTKVDDLFGERIETIFTDSQLRRIIRTGKAESAQKIRRGNRVYMTNRTPIKAGGQIIGAVAVLEDISEFEAIASELSYTKKISRELDAIIESSFDGIYVTDGEGRTIRVNRAYERITGIHREQVLGYTMRQLVDAGFYNQSATLRVLETRCQESLIQKVKTGKTVMVTGNPFFDEAGEITLVVTNVRDVTELYNLQRELGRMEILRTRYETELVKLRGESYGLSKVVIRSAKMKELHDLALRLARVDTTILIVGESGTGKEVFADIVHANSPRREKPFVKISCAAIPEQLLESELFGYVPGAFTGASTRGKAGTLETAQNGTVFLDEIGEIPLGIQAKLLRVLQEKVVVRLGSTEPIPVDIRIIAATNRNLDQMVGKGLFRKDLFFRLNVVPVTIPPLRERKEAILNLALHFLSKYNQRYGFNRQLDADVLSALHDYDWPGNVRELENVVERLVVVSQSDAVTMADFPAGLLPGLETRHINIHQLGGKTLQAALEEVEKRILRKALTQYGSTRKVARALGINQSTVVRKLRRYGLDGDD